MNIEILIIPPNAIESMVEENPELYKMETCNQLIIDANALIASQHQHHNEHKFENKLKVNKVLFVIHNSLEGTFLHDGVKYLLENSYSKMHGIYVFVLLVGNFSNPETYLEDLSDSVLHEMIHEYEEHISVTEDGKKAFEEAKKINSMLPLDKNHSELFFSALCYAAHKQNIPWMELYKKIKSP